MKEPYQCQLGSMAGWLGFGSGQHRWMGLSLAGSSSELAFSRKGFEADILIIFLSFFLGLTFTLISRFNVEQQLV